MQPHRFGQCDGRQAAEPTWQSRQVRFVRQSGDIRSVPGARTAPLGSVAAVRVEQVDFISIPTRDAERASAWYRDVLGLPESDVSEGEVETPNVTLSFGS